MSACLPSGRLERIQNLVPESDSVLEKLCSKGGSILCLKIRVWYNFGNTERSSPVERSVRDREVLGSIPSAPTLSMSL